MKKTAFATFIAFWSSLATLLTVSSLLPAATPAEENATRYTLAEVAEHGAAEDCWLIIRGVVYDISTYVPNHPAPPMVLTPWCGKEATEGMSTKGYGRDHSPAAWEMLAEFQIGLLAEE